MLRFVYVFGWLPALAAAFAVTRGFGAAPRVLTAAGATGARMSLALAITLAILSAGYAAAIRRPPNRGELLWAVCGSVLAAIAMPLLFSADAYAYAYYGELARQGRNPYAHDGALLAGPLARAVAAAWDGHVPPRCVYGPVAVAIAALADAAGSAAGAAGQMFAQRAAAAVTYAAYVTGVLRMTADRRARAVFVLHPTVIWSVGEGHNDAAMVAAAVLGLNADRWRPWLLGIATLVKLPAILTWTAARDRSLLIPAALGVAGYAPLVFTMLSEPSTARPPGDAAAWQSPIGLIAAGIGLTGVGAVGIGAVALLFLAVCAFAARRMDGADRTAALALAAWFVLPNAYPWYALWIVPLAARNISSRWSRALLVAASFAPARAMLDAVFPAADRPDAARIFHPALIALEFVPPLAVLAAAALGRRRIAPALLALTFAVSAFGATAGAAVAQSAVPSPLPLPAPAASGQPAAIPAPAASGTPAAPPAPAASGTPVASPLPAPTPGPVSPPPATPVPVPATPPPVVTPVPTPQPTPNPFGYIITPQPVPATSPDGPHILQVAVNDRHIRAGGPLIVRVLTSANVVAVEARTLGRFIPIPQNSPGLFAAVYTMPEGIPFWLLNRSYDVVIAAATADGRQTSVSFQMVLTR